jgi:DUF1680 family protein
VRVRVPYWADGGHAKLNGRPLESFASPSSYLVFDRTWQDGDRLEVTYPMRLHASPMPDDETLQAFLYGPLVLAGELGTEGLNKDNIRAEPTGLRDIPHYRAKPVDAPALKSNSLRRRSGSKIAFDAGGVRLAPFYTVIDQRYAVYWRVNA